MKTHSDRLAQRLASLEKELEKGQQRMAELERRRIDTQATLLRIDGAIQVVRELLEGQAPAADAGVSTVEAAPHS